MEMEGFLRHPHSLPKASYQSFESFAHSSGLGFANVAKFCGDSGIRTRVQTRNQYAFYTLILALIFEQRQDPSHQPLPYLLHLILASQPTRTSPDISAPLDPISLWALAWSDVSVQHLVPKLGESTILRLRSESYSIVASYNGEPD